MATPWLLTFSHRTVVHFTRPIHKLGQSTSNQSLVGTKRTNKNTTVVKTRGPHQHTVWISEMSHRSENTVFTQASRIHVFDAL